MIQFKSKIGSIEIPTSFSDITIDQYFKIISGNISEIEAVQILTDIEIEKLSMIDFSEIVPYLEFFKDADPMRIEPNQHLQIGEEIFSLPDSLSAQSYAKKIKATRAIQSNDYLKLLCVYLDQIKPTDLNALSVEDVFSCVSYVQEQMKAIFERDKALNNTPTDRQLRAGIKMFNQLGEFNSIDMIAQNYNYTHEQVEELPYDLVFLILVKFNLSAKFDRNLSELK